MEEVQAAEIGSGRTTPEVRDGENPIEIIYSGDSDHFILHRCETAQLHLSCIWSEKLKQMIWRVVDLRVRDRLVEQWWFKTVSQQLWAAHLIGGETSEGIVGVGPKTYFQNADLLTLDAESSDWKLALRALERGEGPQTVPDSRPRRKQAETVNSVDQLDRAYKSRLQGCFKKKKKIKILLTLKQLCDTVDSASMEEDPLDHFTKLDVLKDLVFTALEHEMKGKEIRFGGERKAPIQPSNHRAKFRRINPLKSTSMNLDSTPSAPSAQRIPPKHCVDRSKHPLPPSTFSLRTIEDDKLPRAYKVESGISSEWLHKACQAQEAEENGQGGESGRDTEEETSSSDSSGGGGGGRKTLMEVDEVEGKGDSDDDDDDDDDGSDGMKDASRRFDAGGGGGSHSRRNLDESSTARPRQDAPASSETRRAPPPTPQPSPSTRATRSSAKRPSFAPPQPLTDSRPLPSNSTTSTSMTRSSAAPPPPASTLPIDAAASSSSAQAFVAPTNETLTQRRARKGKGKAVEQGSDDVKKKKEHGEDDAESLKRRIAEAEEKENSSKELARSLLIAFGHFGEVLDARPRYAVDNSDSSSRPSPYFTTDRFNALVDEAIPFLEEAFPLHLAVALSTSTTSSSSQLARHSSSSSSRPLLASSDSRPSLSSSDSSGVPPLVPSLNDQSRLSPAASSSPPPRNNPSSSVQSPRQVSGPAVNQNRLPSREKRKMDSRNPLPHSSDVNQSDSDSTDPAVKKRKLSRSSAIQTRRLSLKAIMQPSKYSRGTTEEAPRKRQKIAEGTKKKKGEDAKKESDGLGVKGDIYPYRALQAHDNSCLYRKTQVQGTSALALSKVLIGS